MPKWTRLLFLLAIVLLVSACRGKPAPEPENVADAPTATMAAVDSESLRQPATPAPRPKTPDLSGIRIVVIPPAEFLVIDPDSLRSGYDPVLDCSFEEIPGATYFENYIEDPDGEGSMSHQSLDIMRPGSGVYRILLSSAAPGLCWTGSRCRASTSPSTASPTSSSSTATCGSSARAARP